MAKIIAANKGRAKKPESSIIVIKIATRGSSRGGVGSSAGTEANREMPPAIIPGSGDKGRCNKEGRAKKICITGAGDNL